MARQKRRHMWTDEEKEELMRGLAAAQSRGETIASYAGSLRMHVGSLRSILNRYRRDHPEFNPAAPVSRELTVRMAPVDVPKRSRDARTFSPQEAQATVREYMSSEPGKKKQWLKEHGLSYATLFNLKLKVAKIQPEFHAPAALNGSFVPASVQTMSPVSLEDAILALEVKRDHYTSVIEDLKRMMRGQ